MISASDTPAPGEVWQAAADANALYAEGKVAPGKVWANEYPVQLLALYQREARPGVTVTIDEHFVAQIDSSRLDQAFARALAAIEEIRRLVPAS